MKAIAFVLAVVICVSALAYRSVSSEYKAAVHTTTSKIEAAEAAALR